MLLLKSQQKNVPLMVLKFHHHLLLPKSELYEGYIFKEKGVYQKMSKNSGSPSSKNPGGRVKGSVDGKKVSPPKPPEK